MAGSLYLAAYFRTDEERAAALELLQKPIEEGCVIEGYGDDDTIAALSARKIVVAVLEAPSPRGAPPPTEESAASAGLESVMAEGAIERPVTIRRSKRTDPSLMKIVERLQANVRKIDLPKASLFERAIWQCARFAMRTFGGITAVTGVSLPAGRVDDEEVYRVTVRGTLRDSWLEQLRRHGIEILAQRRGAYDMFLTPEEVEWLRNDEYVAELSRYNLEDSLHTTLVAQLDPSESKDPKTEQQYDLMLHRAADRARVEQVIRELAGSEAIDESSTMAIRFHAAIDEATLAAIANLPWVRSLMPCNPAQLFTDHARAVVGLPPPPAPPAFRWNGDGEIVGVVDSGIDREHLDLKDRLHTDPVPFEDCPVDDTIGHGTHVAGIIAGTGAAAIAAGIPPISGIAPAAKLVIVGNVQANGAVRLPLDVAPLFDLAVKRDAKILNLSLGKIDTHGLYDPTAESTDQYVRDHPDVLIVVAAGNEGTAPEGFCEFNSVLTPGTAKNVITVGASLTSRNGFAKTWGQWSNKQFPVPQVSNGLMAGQPAYVAALSSRGPTESDSVKPDLVAPGTYILAPCARTIDPKLPWDSFANNAYVYIGGTSMAAPMVAGCAAILRQWLRVERGTGAPSAALLKSLLITAAAKLPTSRSEAGEDQVGHPDFDQGFGRLDLRPLLTPTPKQTLAFVDVANDSKDAVANKKTRSYSTTIAEAELLIVTLVWTDPPGKDVQNQLTLDVVSPDGTFKGNAEHTYLKKPNIFHHRTKGITFDTRNNVQQVRIAAPTPGEYVISVSGFAVLHPKQGFALSVLGALNATTLIRL